MKIASSNKDYPTNIPLLLNNTRVARSYVGGSLINKWKGLPDCGETDRCEEWQMSVIEEQYPGCKPGEGLSKVENILGEPTLKEVIASSPVDYLGEKYCAKYGNECGLGVRTGDSVVRLSLQAHPRPEDAQKYLNFPLGKTEAWYIVETRTINGEHPYVRIGFKEGYRKEKIRKMFYEEDVKGIEESMHKIPIDKGSVILVPAGTPHAMGPGAMFLELADACDFTFKLEHKMPTRRLLDTEMHYGIGFDNMLECFDYTQYTEEEIRSKTILTPVLEEETSDCSIFKCFGYERNKTYTMYKYVVKDSYILKKADHYRVLIPIYGNGSLKTSNGEEFLLKQGSGIFLPQSLEDVTITGNFSFILSDCAEL
jgi:mannose-6-phosphate isomerase